MYIIAKLYLFLLTVIRRIRMIALKPLFKRHGRNFNFDPNGIYSYHTIEVGNDVFIGPGATLSASESGIIFGNKIMLGPNVTMMGGDHNVAEIGRYMYDVVEKRPENDICIVIEDDVWIGSGATILKGVTLGEGSIIAAGAIVNKNVPSYSIVGGIPAKVLKMRFTEQEIILHKKKLNSSNSSEL